MIIVKNIKWDVTDGAEDTTPEEDAEILESLPQKIEVSTEDVDPAEYGLPVDADLETILQNDDFIEAISDFISDEYEFCHAGFDVALPEKQVYNITIQDSASYAIKASSAEAARNMAWDYFHERKPDIDIEIDDEAEPEVEI